MRTVGIVLGACIVACATPAEAGDVVSETSSTPFDGVEITERIEANPSNRIYVAKMSLCTDYLHVSATAPPSGNQTPGAWATAHGAQLATNGDFYTGTQVYGDAVGAGTPWPLVQTGNNVSWAWYYQNYGWIAFGPDWVEFNHTKQTKTVDTMRFGISQGWKPTEVTEQKPSGTVSLVSGFPELVIEGQTYTCSSPTAADCFPDRSDMRARHPRTAMGLSEDRRTFILAVVDGRDSPSSVGMYGAELAQLMADLGAWEAFNLDGGGSTAMWLDGSYVNQPSDGSPRPVANHWGVFAGSANGKPQQASSCFVPGGCFPSALPTAAAEPFRDMPAGSLGHDEAIVMRDRGLTSGCSTDPPLFCPSCTLTRAQAAAFLVRAADIEPMPPTTPTFADVPVDHTFFAAIEAALAAGIIEGCDADNFCPTEGVSRAELAAFVGRARGWATSSPAAASYSDVSDTHAWFGEVEAAAEHCIIDACDGERFCPDDAAPRAVAAIAIVRAFELDGMFPCNPGGAGGSAGTGGAASQGGAAAATTPVASDDGCGCVHVGRGSVPLSSAGWLVLAALLWRRRRARSDVSR